MIQISGLHYDDPHDNLAQILRWLGEKTAKKAKFQRGPACLPGQAISLALIKSKVTPISSLLHTGSTTINYRGWHYTGYTGSALTRNPAPSPFAGTVTRLTSSCLWPFIDTAILLHILAKGTLVNPENYLPSGLL